MRRLAAGVVVALVIGSLWTGASASGRPLLPDLVPLYPEQVIGPRTDMTPDSGLGNPAPLMVNGCFPDETSRKAALRCLRFDSRVGNDGDGPLEVEYRSAGTGFMAYQRIHTDDGSIEEREAVATEFHPTHVHFHIEGFYMARLWEAGRRGPKGSRPPVAVGDKSGFCPEDSATMTGEESDSAYSCFGLNGEPRLPTSFVGISPGWMDIYGAHLPDQFIEISDVADGRYVLELEIDPNNVFLEADETNNRVCSLIELAGIEARMLDIDVRCLKAR